MIRFRHKGDFRNSERLFAAVKRMQTRGILEKYGQAGVDSLSSATPIDSGKTAISWNYVIEITNAGMKLSWTNTNVVDGVPIAIILQYGHGTGSGGYVQGRDYINPAIRPIFDAISEKIWEEVRAL